MAEGQFTWQESGGREVFVRNLAMIVDGRYHVIQVIGPENDRDRVTEVYQQAVASYRTAIRRPHVTAPSAPRRL
ncbi:hypothetical protein SCALM49S_02930 [Streptomyces californicus]